MAWDDGLLGVHREIAATDDRLLHILAGPGTGKTFAMMRRVARLLEAGADPRRLLAVTFTRTAATDLRHQLAALGIPGSEDVRATTLHGLCFGALAAEGVFEATGRTARPLLSHEVEQLVNDLKDDFGGKRSVRELQEAYEAAWARMQREEPGAAPTADERRFEASLLDWLKYHRSMLIGELVPLALHYSRENPALNLLPEFDHVLVDEYQDLNRADQALIERLAAEATLTVIGDDNQSIYSFRYANPEGIRDFPTAFPDSRQFIIEECRRCPPNIVAMSNALIAHDLGRARPTALIADEERAAAEVYIVQHPNLEAEVAAIADFVAHYLQENPDVPPGQVLVLTPRKFVGQRIKRAIIDQGFNSLSYFYEDELDKPDASEGFSLLTLIVRPQDRAALRGWLGLRSSTGLAGGYRRVRRAAEAAQVEPREILDSLLNGEVALPYTRPVVDRYSELINRVQGAAELTGIALVDYLWPPGSPDVADIRLLAGKHALEAADPAELLGALHQEITQPQLPASDGDIVRVMSLHKSKGLTARVVIVAGCVAGALPTIRADLTQAQADTHRAEQRRLLYVAITRATDVLVLSSAARMPLADAMAGGVTVVRREFADGEMTARTAASPFFGEFGGDRPATMSTAAWRGEVGF